MQKSVHFRLLALFGVTSLSLGVANAATVYQVQVAHLAQESIARSTIATLQSQTAQAKAAQQFAESETRRARVNSERLLKMYPVQARRVAAVIKDLEGHKYRPLIDAQVYRSAAQQADLVRRGHSKVYYSFHNVTGKTGRPESLAADVVDAAKFWDADRAFWMKLNSSAHAHSSTTGVAWGLSTANRARLAAAIAGKNWDYKGLLGWDTAHVEPRGLTISQAKKGARPQ